MLHVILGILALSALAGFLALLLEVADSYFADYGECGICINNHEKDLTVTGGGHLMGVLMDEGIFVPSACGGRGSCGLCKLKVLEGAGPLLPTETPYLTPEERKDNVRLSCQVKVRNDLVIEIPPELFLIKEYSARVSRIRDIADQIKEVCLTVEDPEGISFKAGQFIQFEAPEYEKSDEPVYRAYSIASPASNVKELTIVVTRVPQGIATTFIHDFLEEGDEVTFNGPHGEFYLRNSDRDIFLVATGSGLAPIMSLVHQLADEEIHRKATVIFGARKRKDLFYLDDLEALKKRVPDLEVIPVLSRPTEEDAWEGEKGHVTDVLKKIVKDPQNAEAYICGNPAMVESVEQLLSELGVPGDRIFYDKFA